MPRVHHLIRRAELPPPDHRRSVFTKFAKLINQADTEAQAALSILSYGIVRRRHELQGLREQKSPGELVRYGQMVSRAFFNVSGDIRKIVCQDPTTSYEDFTRATIITTLLPQCVLTPTLFDYPPKYRTAAQAERGKLMAGTYNKLVALGGILQDRDTMTSASDQLPLQTKLVREVTLLALINRKNGRDYCALPTPLSEISTRPTIEYYSDSLEKLGGSHTYVRTLRQEPAAMNPYMGAAVVTGVQLGCQEGTPPWDSTAPFETLTAMHYEAAGNSETPLGRNHIPASQGLDQIEATVVQVIEHQRTRRGLLD